MGKKGVDNPKYLTVSPETWVALNKLKEPGDSFDDVINKTLNKLKAIRKLYDEFRHNPKHSRMNIKLGNILGPKEDE